MMLKKKENKQRRLKLIYYIKNCSELILFKNLTIYERSKYFDAIMLLIENNNGDVKEISVFNGKQSSV